MIQSSAELLRMLGSGVRPDGATPGAPSGGAPDFEALLARARSGSLETGLPVSVASGAGVELDGAQLARLGRVVDRAHAEGASRVVVMMDGMALDVDVLSRRVLGRADLEGGKVLTGIDGLVNLGEGEGEAAPVLALPGARPVDASVLKLLAGGDAEAA